MVVGTRGAGGFTHLLTGSVSSQLAAHAHAPVIVVRPAPGEDPARMAVAGTGPVVVGLDGSAGSAATVAFAVEEAATRAVPLTAVYVWHTRFGDNPGAVTPEQLDALAGRAEAHRILSEATAGWSEKYPDLAIERRAVHGTDPARALLREAAGASLLVVGTRGHGEIAGALLGSVSHAMLAHSQQTVAVVGP